VGDNLLTLGAEDLSVTPLYSPPEITASDSSFFDRFPDQFDYSVAEIPSSGDGLGTFLWTADLSSYLFLWMGLVQGNSN
ncbi:hypothetical protein, partial [Tritonibacter sp. SIMBA_163]|uniref:hypothetical protein n=1 Tax=Tritonibacter sp. SIMBA_163 TaxID=3080868 RepID=UPI003980E243